MSDLLKLENQLCHRFYLLSNAFTRAYRPLLDQLDITYPQYIVMMALWEQDQITVANVVEKTGIDGGAMSLILKKLAQKEYLFIERSEHDKRVKHVHLTELGQQVKSQAINVPKQMLCKLDGMTLDEAKQLALLLDKLQSCFDDSSD